MFNASDDEMKEVIKKVKDELECLDKMQEVGLAYNIPNENEIKENVQLMDKIIKDY